jgi:hypothetical protein
MDRPLAASDIDAQGNVTLWDSGPVAGSADSEAARAAAEAEDRAWHKQYGDGPVPIMMHSQNAVHALAVEPNRYSVEPRDLDEGAVSAEVERIQKARAEAKKAAEDRQASIELNQDRVVAVATVAARRAAQKAAPVAADDRIQFVDPPPPAVSR